jgi:hypothetical protein
MVKPVLIRGRDQYGDIVLSPSAYRPCLVLGQHVHVISVDDEQVEDLIEGLTQLRDKILQESKT